MSGKPSPRPLSIPRWQPALSGGLLFLPFALGHFFPDYWWTTHFTAFLPREAGGFLLLLAAFFCAAPLWDRKNALSIVLEPGKKFRDGSGVGGAALLGLLYGAICFAFPIHFDFFGDAPTILADFQRPDVKVDHWGQLLNPDLFHPRTGEITVTNLAAILAGWTGGSPQGAFAIIGAVSAALYAFVCMLAVRRRVKAGALRFLLMTAFLVTPSALVFMGHIEVYAPLWPVLALFCWLVLRYFEGGKPGSLIGMLVVLLLALKLHISSLLLIPLVGLCALHYFLGAREAFRKRMNWKWMGLTVMLPLLVVAMVVYFGVLGDHRDPRFLDGDVSSFERLFLPLFSPDPPLDRYNLFSPAHLGDVFNFFLLWSPLGLILVAGGAWMLRGHISWNRPEVMAFGLLLILYTGLLFLINPLLGMPFDWDLMAIAAPFLGFLALALWKDAGDLAVWRQMTGPAIGLIILVLPMLYVHSGPAPLSGRLESMGRHAFRGYWIRSAGDIQAGLSLIGDDPALYTERYLANLEALRPAANPGNDQEYAALAAGLGKFLRKQKDIPLAEKYHRLAYDYYPQLDYNLIGLVECAYFRQAFAEALPWCEQLVAMEYPSLKKALAIGTEMAIRAGDLGRARTWVERYHQSWPANEGFRVLYEGLRTGKSREELLRVFGG